MTESLSLSLGPLSGLRVLEFGQIAAGPFAGSLLADLGADVVKIERPDGGDGMRQWPPLSVNDEGESFSENFAALNRNKRSATFDLKNGEGRQRLFQLVEAADVLIENFRAGVLTRLGFGYDVLREMNPKLVYCSISGYGHRGPYAEKGAFDVTIQAISGLMSVTGEAGAAPTKCGVPVGDFCAGLYAAYTITAAVMAARQTGRGQFIDCSMLGSLLGVAALQTSEYFGSGVVPRALGSAHPRNAPYQAFQASDDYFVIAAGNDALWRQVCEAVGQPELAADERFATQQQRAANQADLVAILNPLFTHENASYWLAEMDSRGVPCAPINTYAEVLSDPQIAAMNLVRPLQLPNGVVTQTTAFPAAFSEYEFQIDRPPPILGADTEAVCSQWLEAGPHDN